MIPEEVWEAAVTPRWKIKWLRIRHPRAQVVRKRGRLYVIRTDGAIPTNPRWTAGYCFDHDWWFGDDGCPDCAPSDPTSTV